MITYFVLRKIHQIIEREIYSRKTRWILYLIAFLLILYFFLSHLLFAERSYENYQKISSPIEYSNLLYRNLSAGKLTNLMVEEEDLRREDCSEICGEKDCQQMFERKRNLSECQKCHQNPRKCYQPSISGGNCYDCSEDEKQIPCSDISYYGCPAAHRLLDRSGPGVEPYYLLKTTFSADNQMNQECHFCHQLDDLI